MGITAKELAQKLRLSEAAVSIALNNKPGVSTETRRMVWDAAAKYGYDFTRHSDRRITSGHVYFVIYRRHGAVVADAPFFSQVSEGIVSFFKHNQQKLKILYVYEEEISKQVGKIAGSDCMGLILLGTEMCRSDINPFLQLGKPLVLLYTYFESADFSCVLINNAQGACLAVSYLIQKCKVQPGYLKSAYPIENFSERSNGFYKAIHEAGMSAHKSIVHMLTPSLEGAYTDMLEAIQRGEELASCYFADNDLIALGAMKAFQQCGFRIPEDISIVGFDDLPDGETAEPPLTTIHVPKQHLGEAAARQLLFSMQHPGKPNLKIEVLTSLISRKSVRGV